MKYILTGAQGTGKTSILKKLEGKMTTITEVVRNLAKTEGINVNENGDREGQSRIFNTYYEKLSETDGPYISDRGLTDVIAYTCYNMHNKGEEGQKFIEDQINKFIQFSEKNDDVVYFYVPIEFDVEDDGFRSTNEEFRKEIDTNISELFEYMENLHMGLNVFTLRGSVEERLETMEGIMRNYGDIQ